MAIELPARIAFLKKIHLFHGLEDSEIAAIAEELDEVAVAKDGVVFQQDSKADSFYLIYGGTVRIVRKQQGREFELARFVKDDYFGEMALIAKRSRSAMVVATSDTLLLVLSRDDFEKLYKQNPNLRLNLTVAIRSRQLARRLRFKWLRPNEVVYFLARKHPVILVQNLVLPVLVLALPLGLFYGWLTLAPFLIVLIAAVGSLLAVLAWIAWRTVDWGNDYYIVTNQRVVWLEKVVGIYDSRQESPLSTVLSVGLESTPAGRALDYGNVIVRTFVGKIPFNHVNHPAQAARMVEEYWQRTRKSAVGLEKEAMKDAIRRRLGLPIPPKPSVDHPVSTASAVPKRLGWLRLLGSDTLKLRYEMGDNVIYRKHWFVMVQQAWMPLGGIFAAFVLFVWRLIRLAQSPGEVFIKFVNGQLVLDTFALALLIAFVPLLIWLTYEILDWSNDKFEVTPEQIIDIDRKPFGTETRGAAQLENILATEYRRIGIFGNVFNFGTVYITVGGTKLAFEDVMDPASVQSDIDRRRAARMEKKAQGAVAAERERMAEWLVTYHRSAEEFRREEEKKSNQKPG